MRKIAIAGMGRIGSFVANSFKNKGLELLLLDINQSRVKDLGEKLDSEWKVVNLLSLKDVQKKIKDIDLIVSALPGSIAHKALLNLISVGVNIVDISYFSETLKDVDIQARKNGIIIMVDCGIAPGLSNMLVGAGYSMLGGLSEVLIYAGEITETYISPWGVGRGYDVRCLLDAYRKPARVIVNGSVVMRDPLNSEVGRIYVDKVGELEYFPFEGLRSILKSFPHLEFGAVYALRWPGHIGFLRALENIGLLSHRKINGKIYADECVSKVIESTMHNVRDLMVLVVETFKGRKGVRFTQLVRSTEEHCALIRAAGSFLVCISLNMLEGKIDGEGVMYPEDIGKIEENSINILEKLALENMGVKEEFITKKRR